MFTRVLQQGQQELTMEGNNNFNYDAATGE
jgi:hypothetical protein